MPCMGGWPSRLLLQLLEELRQRLPQLLHQALDFLVGGTLLKRLRQALLGGAQRALGVGEIAVLDAQGNVPQLRQSRCCGPPVWCSRCRRQ